MAGPRGAGSSRSSDDLHNEDAFLVSDELGLYAVCDGRSDTPAGEVAAYVAVDAIERFVEGLLGAEADDESTPSESILRPIVTPATVEHAIRFALEEIVAAAEERRDFDEMATTVTLLLVQRGRAFIGHSGDSRAYLVRGDQLVQLTTDHEWTTDGTSSQPHGRERVESFSVATQSGDTFVLCTDGAESQIANADLLDAMQVYSPRVVASRLVSAAHRALPEEDATAVVVRIREDHAFAWASLREPPQEDGRRNVLSLQVVGRRAQQPYAIEQLFSGPPGRAGHNRTSRFRAKTTPAE